LHSFQGQSSGHARHCLCRDLEVSICSNSKRFHGHHIGLSVFLSSDDPVLHPDSEIGCATHLFDLAADWNYGEGQVADFTFVRLEEEIAYPTVVLDVKPPFPVADRAVTQMNAEFHGIFS
jgi:hypothetical protein